MSIRVALAPLFHTDEDVSTLEAAIGIARRFGGHVDALFARPDPADTIPLVGEGVSADTIRQLMESAAVAVEEQRKAVKKTFDRVCTAADIALADHPDKSGGQPSAGWTEIVGQSEDVVPAKALLSDLVVFASASSKDAPALRPSFESVLLRSRRPILLVPGKFSGHVGHNVAIAWNGTTEAASAVKAAKPFLESAVAVHLLTAATSRTDVDEMEDLSAYLAWHDIGSDRHVVEVAGESAGTALMRKALDVGADLLVMGGYGHHRLRERILGGVTHHVLNHAELPVLLAH